MLLWADAFEYDLFVCLGIQTRSPETRKDYQEPTSEFSIPFNLCTHSALCAVAKTLLLKSVGGREQAKVAGLKTMCTTGPWPRRSDPITLSEMIFLMGPNSGEESTSVQVRLCPLFLVHYLSSSLWVRFCCPQSTKYITQAVPTKSNAHCYQTMKSASEFSLTIISQSIPSKYWCNSKRSNAFRSSSAKLSKGEL